MPSKSAARIAQTFTATDHSAKIQSDQWEEQTDLYEHTDGVGIISPVTRHDLEAKYKSTRGKIASRLPHFNLDFSDTRELSSWTTDFKASRCACASRSAISPCRTLTRRSSKIARSFDYTNPVYLSRFVVLSFLVNTNLKAIFQTCSDGVGSPWCR
jgi:RNA dependent RNA polymerase